MSSAKRATLAADEPTGVVVAARARQGKRATREVCAGDDDAGSVVANDRPVRAWIGPRR